MSERERSDAGTFVETVTLEDVRGVFDAVRGPVVTSSDVADALGCTTEAARQKLRRLVDRGELEKRKTGRTVVYWRAVDEERREPPRDAARSDPGNDPGADTDAEEPPIRPESGDEDLAGVVDRIAEGWDDPPERIDARKAAARAVLEHAREHGTVSKKEAKEEVRPEYPVEGQNARTWYRKNIRPVLNEAAEYDESVRAYRLDLGEA
jgi:ribosomal protein S25